MSHKAEPLSKEEGDRISQLNRLSKLKGGLKGTVIGGTAGAIGGHFAGKAWGSKNGKEATKAKEAYKKSLTEEQSKLRKKVKEESRRLSEEANAARWKGAPEHAIYLAQSKHRHELKKDRNEFEKGLTSEQRATRRKRRKQENIQNLKVAAGTVGGAILGGVAGNKIGKATSKKYSAEDNYSLKGLSEKLEALKAKKKEASDKSKAKVEKFLKYVVTGKKE